MKKYYFEKKKIISKLSQRSANKCLLKVAQFAAQSEKYQKAIEIYEQIGTSSVDNALLKYGAKDHFFRAALCHLCIDVLNCQVIGFLFCINLKNMLSFHLK